MKKTSNYKTRQNWIHNTIHTHQIQYQHKYTGRTTHTGKTSLLIATTIHQLSHHREITHNYSEICILLIKFDKYEEHNNTAYTKLAQMVRQSKAK